MEVLRRKLHQLARGDDGVALVVTLALFMFLYVSCAGVFAVGQAVKERVILQNAVDAAAYSAAMIEADTLSRIATINRSMAWTYKTLVCSQMDWIALKTLSESREKYQNDLSFKSDGNIAPSEGEKVLREGYIGIEATRFEENAEKYNRPVVDLPTGADVESRLGELEGLIATYSEQLDEMTNAIDSLVAGLCERERQVAKEVLEANLPARIGDLCRFEVKCSADFFREMSPSEESQFLGFANETDEDFRRWLALDEEAEGSFRRRYAGKLQTFWTYWDKVTHNPVTLPTPDVRAEDYKSECEEAYDGHKARPLVLERDYFPDEASDIGHVARGAVTVAVAKKNENPWRGVTDGEGFYKAFEHAGATEWSVAIASAQAGYRDVDYEEDDDDMKKRPAYSLRWVDYDDWDRPLVYWNLASPDWNAVFLPVRKAFKRGSAADSLKEWMREGTWERLVDAPKHVADLKEFDVADVNRQTLPRMHNNGGAGGALDWGDDEFLDLFYH